MNKVIHFRTQTLNSLHKNACANISECTIEDATKKINNEK